MSPRLARSPALTEYQAAQSRHAIAGFATGHHASDIVSRAAQRARCALSNTPDAAHRVLSIERTTSTPRASATTTRDTGQCSRCVTSPASLRTTGGASGCRFSQPSHLIRGVKISCSTPPPTRPLVRRIYPRTKWSGHLLSPVDARARLEERTGLRCGEPFPLESTGQTSRAVLRMPSGSPAAPRHETKPGSFFPEVPSFIKTLTKVSCDTFSLSSVLVED